MNNQKKSNSRVSENIVEYIKRNKISVAQIEKDTGIHMSEFIDNYADFSAGDFLDLCSYLLLDPNDMRYHLQIRK